MQCNEISFKFLRSDLSGFFISLSNAWGVILILILLSYGLVSVPKQLWSKANYNDRMSYLEWMAQDIHTILEEKNLDLVENAEVMFLSN